MCVKIMWLSNRYSAYKKVSPLQITTNRFNNILSLTVHMYSFAGATPPSVSFDLDKLKNISRAGNSTKFIFKTMP